MPDDDVLVEATFAEIVDETVTENPNTGDSIMTYVGLAIVGFGTLLISAKKLRNQL